MAVKYSFAVIKKVKSDDDLGATAWNVKIMLQLRTRNDNTADIPAIVEL
jgi:hypothetical protein